MKLQYLFTKQQILDLSKVKAFAGEKMNVTLIWKFFIGWVENIAGHGENAGFPQGFQKASFPGLLKSGLCGEGLIPPHNFLLFPQCFQKASFPGLLKFGIMW